jgi:flagellar hook-associated protein 1 FlgK
MLDGGKALANRFVQLNTHLNNLNGEVNNGLLAGATEVNRLAQEIAQINGAIGTNIATAAPDLLDRRDQLITQLIGYTGGTAVIQDGGIVNVYTAGGNALVVGTTATKVTTVADPYQPERLQLALETQGNTIRLDAKAVGGQIGGLLEFRDTVLTPAQAELGKLAVAWPRPSTRTHHQGVDMYGQLGGDFFNIGNPRVTANNANTGTASLSATYGDLGKLDAQNVVLQFDGTQWKASRADTGANVPLTGTGTAADPLVINGVKLVVGGTPAANDRFLLQAAGVAGSMEVAITDPSRIAAAAAVKGAAATSNTGTGKLSGVTVSDSTNANLRNPAAIVFTLGHHLHHRWWPAADLHARPDHQRQWLELVLDGARRSATPSTSPRLGRLVGQQQCLQAGQGGKRQGVQQRHGHLNGALGADHPGRCRPLGRVFAGSAAGDQRQGAGSAR